MIEPGRTNVLPRTLLVLCVGLFLARAAAIYYATFSLPPQQKMVDWQPPKEIDRSRKDLLSTPTLYYFCEATDPVSTIMSQIQDSMLFHNREIAQLLKEAVIPIKVTLKGENSDALSKSLKNSCHILSTPAFCVTLPNGAIVDSTSWQSDRMFVAYLKDAVKRSLNKAAVEAMKRNDFALACRAFEADYKNNVNNNRFDLYDTMYWSIALRHQKDDTKARNVLIEARDRYSKYFKFDKNDNWPEPCINYMLGEISQEELMKKASEKKEKYSYKEDTARYICGTKFLLEGNVELAKKELKPVADSTSARYHTAAKFARAELRALGEHYPEKAEEDDDSSY